MAGTWRKLKVSRAELQLGPTLCGGQSFRWNNVETDKWIGVFGRKVWILKQEDNHLLYKVVERESSNSCVKGETVANSDEETENILKSYFRLDVDLSHYYRIWSEADVHFREAAPKLFGIRILNQDVTENLFSFICSSNNNIKRISSMVEKLCELYGDEIAEVNEGIYRSFPAVERLTETTVQSDLKDAGFGYRAKFIYQAACLIKKLGGQVWLENLKLLPYQDAKKELMNLPGIGPKVADCICLMSLGHMEAVPVDTHIFNVATKMYLPELKKYKSVTNKVYNAIGDHFRSLHGPYAGWANTVLAKKGGSSEEDRNGYGSFQVWPVNAPGRGPKPFKFKGPKHQMFVVGRPPYPQQPYYPQGPQYQGGQQQISPLEIQQYLEGIDRQMQESSANAYNEFQKIENEIESNRKNLENFLKSQFQALEVALEAKQAKEVQQAVKDGKDETKIQECLAEEEQAARAEMNADIDRTLECMNDATKTARKALLEARNSYTEVSFMSSFQARDSAQKIRFCAEQRNYQCVQEGVTFINERTKSTVEEGNRRIRDLQEAPRHQMIQMKYCRENFMDDLREMRTTYTNMVKRCIIASEPEQEEVEVQDEDEQEKEINVNVEVKPDAEAEVQVEA